MNTPPGKADDKEPVNLVEGEDYYWEKGLMVFTSAYHLKRGYCCNSGCRHCPYNDRQSIE